MMQIPRVRVQWGRTVAATMLVALAGALALLFAASGAWGQTDEVRSQPPREQSGDTGTAAIGLTLLTRRCSTRPSGRAPSG